MSPSLASTYNDFDHMSSPLFNNIGSVTAILFQFSLPDSLAALGGQTIALAITAVEANTVVGDEGLRMDCIRQHQTSKRCRHLLHSSTKAPLPALQHSTRGSHFRFQKKHLCLRQLATQTPANPRVDSIDSHPFERPSRTIRRFRNRCQHKPCRRPRQADSQHADLQNAKHSSPVIASTQYNPSSPAPK